MRNNQRKNLKNFKKRNDNKEKEMNYSKTYKAKK